MLTGNDAFIVCTNIYFNVDHKLEDLKCEKCIEYELRKCKGKEYSYIGVLECLKEKINNISGNEYFNCIEKKYGVKMRPANK